MRHPPVCRRLRPMAAGRHGKGEERGDMLGVFCLATFTVLIFIGMLWNFDNPTYVCPACGSRNGDHADGCQWKR